MEEHVSQEGLGRVPICMCMWRNMFPKMGQDEYLCRSMSYEVLEILASKDDLILDQIQYPYVGMDLWGSENILVTYDKPTNMRGNIMIIF